MDYEEKCGTCGEFKDKRNDCKEPFDINYAKYEKGYCEYRKTFYWAEDSCYYYHKRESDSSLCYITTIICEKLGYSDNCGVLNTLRGFRDNVMQKDCKYCKILFEYDVIGPKIAEMIRQDNDTDEEIWIAIYNFYLSATANLIKEEKYEEAVKRYTEMVNALKEYYSISEDIKEIVENYDMQQGGHGKVKLITRNGEI